MVWSFVQTFGRQGINFLFFAVLAIKLTPDELGVVGIAIVVSAFIQSFSELGFGAALIQKKNTTNGHYSSVFFANLLLGVTLAVICFLFADVISAAFNSDRIAPILRVLSIGFIVNSSSLSHIALLQKELRFRDLAKRDVCASIAGAIAGITAVFSGAGVWSIVAQLITYYIVGAVIVWYLSAWRPHYKEFSSECIRGLWPYSSKILMTNVLNFGVKNTDKILIGGALGPYALGIYTFAYNLVLLPITSINSAIGAYLFPKYSAMQDEVKMVRSSYLSVLKLTLLCMAPFIIVFSQTAHVFVDLIWGGTWSDAIPTMKVLCALAIIGSFVAPSGQLMKSFGRPDWLLYWSIFIVILQGTLIFLGINMAGLLGVSLALLLSCVICIPIIIKIMNKLIGTKFMQIIELIGPTVVASASMFPVFFIANFYDYTEVLNLSVTTVAALIIYLTVLIFMDKPVRDAAKLFRSRELNTIRLMTIIGGNIQ